MKYREIIVIYSKILSLHAYFNSNPLKTQLFIAKHKYVIMYIKQIQYKIQFLHNTVTDIVGFYHITFISFFVNMRPNEIMKLTYTRKTHSRVSIVLASVVVLLVSLLLVGEVQFDKNPKYKRHDIHMLIYPYLYGYINVCRELVCYNMHIYIHIYNALNLIDFLYVQKFIKIWYVSIVTNSSTSALLISNPVSISHCHHHQCCEVRQRVLVHQKLPTRMSLVLFFSFFF